MDQAEPDPHAPPLAEPPAKKEPTHFPHVKNLGAAAPAPASGGDQNGGELAKAAQLQKKQKENQRKQRTQEYLQRLQEQEEEQQEADWAALAGLTRGELKNKVVALEKKVREQKEEHKGFSRMYNKQVGLLDNAAKQINALTDGFIKAASGDVDVSNVIVMEPYGSATEDELRGQ